MTAPCVSIYRGAVRAHQTDAVQIILAGGTFPSGAVLYSSARIVRGGFSADFLDTPQALATPNSTIISATRIREADRTTTSTRSS